VVSTVSAAELSSLTTAAVFRHSPEALSPREALRPLGLHRTEEFQDDGPAGVESACIVLLEARPHGARSD
jgi:hypothetical protein